MTGGLSKKQWRQILEVITRHPNIHAIVLYGSRAMGNFANGSDIDLALKGDNITSKQLTRIGLDYENLYLPWKLDLTLYEDITNVQLREHINRIGKALK